MTFLPDETDLEYCHLKIDDDGSIEYDEGGYLLDNRSESDDARQEMEEVVQDAASVCAEAQVAINENAFNFGQVAQMIDALYDLNSALGKAMAMGNLGAAAMIINQKAALPGNCNSQCSGAGASD